MPFESCGLRLRDRGRCSFLLGSARASRAGDGALAIANFSFREHCGEAPQWAREARALPEFFRPAE